MLLMKRFLFFSLAICPISLFAAGGLPDRPYIYVEGRAEIEKPADMVTLRFEFVGRAPELPRANADVQAKSNKVFALLRERKIGDPDIIAGDLSSEPEFEKDENSQKHGKLVGYKVTRSFRVDVREFKIFPKLVDDIIAIGGVEFRGIYGGLAKQKEFENEGWDKALANAREQAEKTVQQMNMKIDSLFAISPVPIPEITSTMFPKESARAGVESVVVTGSNIPTGEEPTSQYHIPPVSITQIVHVIYLISPAK